MAKRVVPTAAYADDNIRVIGAFLRAGIAAGIELDKITTTWDKWVTPRAIPTAKGRIEPGDVAAIDFTINDVYRGETRIQLRHVNRIGPDAAPDWPRGSQDDVYRVEIEGSPSITQETAFRFTDGSGRDPATAGCLATGLRALNAVPAVNELPPGWVTPLDLPLIPGAGTIR
jgi:2,4-diaminopentanoate dehydrogenase